MDYRVYVLRFRSRYNTVRYWILPFCRAPYRNKRSLFRGITLLVLLLPVGWRYILRIFVVRLLVDYRVNDLPPLHTLS
ncbi:hypothetical protein D1872_264710 [compost metagenome]